MREIIFRGKRGGDGEWEYGIPIKNWWYGSCSTYIVEDGSVCAGELQLDDMSEIIPETIGQYTGLKDKNGTMIFEGDILRFPAQNEYEKETFVGYEVFYHDNDSADNHIGFQMNRMHFYGALCGGTCLAKMLPKFVSRMEIIGNIHDKPQQSSNS